MIAAIDPMPTAPWRNWRRSGPIIVGRPASSAGPVRGASHQSTPSDTAVPINVGNIFANVGSGRMTTAHAPITPTATVSPYAMPFAPRTASTPMIPPRIRMTISAPATSTALSLVPNCSIAQFFSHAGV